ncbi:MAG: hypothetical protein AAGL29_01610 [Bacteroidota bacterium]
MKKLVSILIFGLTLVVMAQKDNPEKSFSHAVQLNTTPETAWDALVDFSNFKQWDDTVVAVKCPLELKKNKRCQTILEGGVLLEVEILDIVENESYTLRYKLSSGNMFIKRTLAKNEQLQLEEEVWYKGLSKKTFERYKGDDYQNIIQTRMENFKTYVENETGQGK